MVLPSPEVLVRVAAGAALIGAVAGLATLAWGVLARAPIAVARLRVACLMAASPLAVAGLCAMLASGWRDVWLTLCAVAPFFGMATLTGIARLARPLPRYVSAVSAARAVPDLILGERHAPGDLTDVDAFNPAWVKLPEKALYTNLHVVGGIGSGKTSGIALPLLDQLIHKRPPGGPPFVLLLDVKGGLAETVRIIAARAGRLDDVIELTPGGAETVNLLGGDPAVAAARLLDALAEGADDGGHPFYRQAQEAFVRAALALMEYVGAPLHIGELYAALTDPDVRAELIARGESLARSGERPRCLDYFRHTFGRLREDEAQGMLLGLSNALALWVDGPVGRMVCTARPTFAGWRDAIGRGRIVVITLPESTYGEALCRRIGLMLLTGFCDAALARTDPTAAIDRDRLVVALIDEAQKFMCRRLATFASVSRQAKCFTVLLHQNLAQIPEAYRDDLAANFRSHLVLNVSDAFTAQQFSRQLGEAKVERVSRGRSRNRGPRASHGTSETTTEVWAPRWPYTAIMQLPPQRGILSLFDGERLRDPQLIRLHPWHLPGNAIGGEAEQVKSLSSTEQRRKSGQIGAVES